MATTQLYKARDDPSRNEILVIHRSDQRIPNLDGWRMVSNDTDAQGIKKTYRRMVL